MNFFGRNKKVESASPQVTLPSLTVTTTTNDHDVRHPPQEAFASTHDTTQIDLTVPREEQPRGPDKRFSIGGSYDEDDDMDDIELANDGDDVLVVVDTNRLSRVVASRRQANYRRYVLIALAMVVAVAAIAGCVHGIVGSSGGSSTDDVTKQDQMLEQVPVAANASTGEDLIPGEYDQEKGEEVDNFDPETAEGLSHIELETEEELGRINEAQFAKLEQLIENEQGQHRERQLTSSIPRRFRNKKTRNA